MSEEKSFKYPSQKQKQGRVIYGTLTSPENHHYTGSNEEEESIINYLKGTSKAFLWCLLGQERHQSGKIHYHYLVKYKSVVRAKVCDRMYEYFHSISGAKSDRIIFGGNTLGNMIGYITKDGKYRIEGDDIPKLDSIIERYQKKQQVTQLNESEGLNIRKEVLKEVEVVQWLTSFMNSKGYKVNWHTRQLVGVSKKDFFSELHQAGFHLLFGTAGLKLAESHIDEIIYHDLPMWKPDVRYVKFKDFFWNLETGMKLSLETAEKRKIIPVREYDVLLSGKEPVLFLENLKRCGMDVSTFRDAYGEQFKPKKRRGKSLLIYGDPSCGKSTLAVPFIDVFKDIIGDWTDDGGFSVASIASAPVVMSEEVSPFDRSYNMNAMKKLLEGVVFNVKRKHSTKVEVCPKTVLFLSNDPPPEIDDANSLAIKDRLNMFKASRRILTPDLNMMDRIKAETPRVLVWATRRKVPQDNDKNVMKK